MPNKNFCTVIGHLGKDPDLRFTASGTPVCTFSVATSSGKDERKKTEWHKINVWKDLAEVVSKEFHKGDAIHCEGPIETRTWEDGDGAKRYSTEITAWYVARPIYANKVTSQPPKQTQQQPAQDESDLPF